MGMGYGSETVHALSGLKSIHKRREESGFLTQTGAEIQGVNDSLTIPNEINICTSAAMNSLSL